ncbi:hypothetical protein [Citrobacter europaeus]|uniref:hypothetical protein n=1 Tax=Citrobacter europaeus TaxID=1914243 RepID=UPI000B36009F|nr:hypothetical protein [Citrobacter europaeus]UBI17857.1 hypothetical protein LA337_09280 [Citrobacter europaeus]
MINNRSANVIPTNYKGISYRSQTEARWAVFFDTLGLTFRYEPEQIQLSTKEIYIPDFYIEDFDAYFEVKPSNDEIISVESRKARILSYDRPGQRVWLAAGGPSLKTPNILPLDKWGPLIPIEHILSTPEWRYWIHEDRRDEQVYWLHSFQYEGYEIGGPGESTFHFREPLEHRNVMRGFVLALEAFR